MKQTYQTLLKDQNEFKTSYMNAFGAFFGTLERKLFVDLHIRKKSGIKSAFSREHGISSRQYNSLLYLINGKTESAIKKREHDIENVKQKIDSIANAIKKKQAEKLVLHAKLILLKPRTYPFIQVQKKYQNIKQYLHGKKRKMEHLKQKISKLETDKKEKKIRICFGSRKLFNAQHHLEKSSYTSFLHWKLAWEQARSDHFYILGSKDETYGNQSCTYDLDNRLRMKVANSFVTRFGKYITFDNVYFPYGHEQLDACKKVSGVRKNLGQGTQTNLYQAITYTLVRKKKGWYIFATVEVNEKEITTSERVGYIGVDLNAGFLSVCEVDRFGNPNAQFDIQVPMYHRSHHQIKASLGEALAQIVAYAKKKGKPIAFEHLKFTNKRNQLGEAGKKYKRMLSGFAYSAYEQMLIARAKKEGVYLKKVSPAYTSQIGHVKFMKRYGLSSHSSAACVIARRGLRLKFERLNFGTPLGKPKKIDQTKSRFSQWKAFSKYTKEKYGFNQKIELLKKA